MPAPAKLGPTLFITQCISALSVFLFASQQEKFAWAGWVTCGCLALWAALSIPLLLIYERFLLQRFLSVVFIPLAFFFLFNGLPPADPTRAALWIPLSVTLGLICIIAFETYTTALSAAADRRDAHRQAGDNNV